MKKPSESSVKKLFALSGNRCAFPNCSDSIIENSGTICGEIGHIEAASPGGPRYNSMQSDTERNAYENLILLCRRHHKIIDDLPESYTVDALCEMKNIHENKFRREERIEDSFFAKILLGGFIKNESVYAGVNLINNSPGSTQSNVVNITTQSRNVKIFPPRGIIGEDQIQVRYLTYLIKRYNEFASKNTSRGNKFSFGAISKNIEHNFGAPWKLISSDHFNKVCEYVQGRITKTIIAKNNQSKGWDSFKSFKEFQQKPYE